VRTEITDIIGGGWETMWGAAILLFAAAKCASWKREMVLSAAPAARWKRLAYFVAWPGMDAGAFVRGASDAGPRERELSWAAFKITAGAVLIWCMARQFQPMIAGWIGMIGFILLVHFGLFQMFALVWQTAGVDARPIMNQPWRAKSVSEFWGQRWNLAFRDLAHEQVFRPLRRMMPPAMAMLAAFAISGLIHELVITVPSGGGYGGPMFYFVLQGSAVLLERFRIVRQLRLRSSVMRLWTILIVAAPIGLLFPPIFISNVVIPFMKVIHAL